MEQICKYESCTNPVVQNDRGGPRRLFCNEKCTRKQAVTDKRRRIKLKVVEYLGGQCQRCGWDEHPAGLVAHHYNPAIKSFGISLGNTKSWAKMEPELDKCILLCQNCNVVIHATNDPFWIYIPA